MIIYSIENWRTTATEAGDKGGRLNGKMDKYDSWRNN